jgi:hypothetical protein
MLLYTELEYKHCLIDMKFWTMGLVQSVLRVLQAFNTIMLQYCLIRYIEEA